MSNIITCKGLVIRETAYGESDKCLTVLTDERGSITVFCKGAKNYKSKYFVVSSLFCYGDMVLYEKGDRYWLSEGSLIENFFVIRDDISTFALAQYFLDVTCDITNENQRDPGVLRLLLNTLFVLSKKQKPLPLVKAVFEMRLCSLCGFAPDLVGCAKCGAYENERMYFDIPNGAIFCGKCASSEVKKTPVSSTVLHAMRWALFCDMSRLFSFEIPEDEMRSFSSICERYILTHLDRGFKTLDFYHDIEGL